MHCCSSTRVGRRGELFPEPHRTLQTCPRHFLHPSLPALHHPTGGSCRGWLCDLVLLLPDFASARPPRLRRALSFLGPATRVLGGVGRCAAQDVQPRATADRLVGEIETMSSPQAPLPRLPHTGPLPRRQRRHTDIADRGAAQGLGNCFLTPSASPRAREQCARRQNAVCCGASRRGGVAAQPA